MSAYDPKQILPRSEHVPIKLTVRQTDQSSTTLSDKAMKKPNPPKEGGGEKPRVRVLFEGDSIVEKWRMRRERHRKFGMHTRKIISGG